MMKKLLAPFLAIIMLLMSSSVVVLAEEETLHASASIIEYRVQQRRAARISKQIPPTSTHTSSTEHGRDNYLRFRSRKRTTDVQRSVMQKPRMRKTTVQDRVTQRRKLRLGTMPLSSPQIVLLDAFNSERAQLGIFPLRYNALLGMSAQAHADDMLERQFFSHENPDGATVKERINNTGYGDMNAQTCNCTITKTYGENIAQGHNTIPEVVAAWMASKKGHREGILSKQHTEIGVGIAGDMWVVNFGNVEVTRIE